MEHNPGDSSSESDISDPWSIIDRDSCEPEEIPTDNSVKDKDSVSGEVSDGESLEVIDEEGKHDEYKDADMDTDGISIITESEINDELEHPLSLAVSKEKKYLHHPNTYLNTRLNVLLAISLAAVTGLGLGHFLGLQEECPLVNESTASLLAKLQHDNEILRNQLEELQSDKIAASTVKKIHDLDCKVGLELNNKGVLDFEPSLEDDIEKHSFHWKTNIPSVTHLDRDKIVPEFSTSNNLNQNAEDEIVEQTEEKEEGSAFNKVEAESLILNKEDGRIAIDTVTIPNIESSGKIINEVSVALEDTAYPQSRGQHHSVDELINDDISETFIDNPNQDIYATSSFVPKVEKIVAESVVKQVLPTPSLLDDEVLVVSVEDSNVFETPSLNTQSSEDGTILTKSIYETNKQQSKLEGNVNSNMPQSLPEVKKEMYTWDKNNIEIVKLTLKLLQAHFDNDIVSPDTGNILTSAVALTSDLQKSFIQLQDIIIDCKAQKSEFCVHLQKKMESSLKKLRETMDGLVDDIDERMFKLLMKIARKLQKYKGNLQDKWCHLADKYASESDAVHNWFQGEVLLECRNNARQSKKNANNYSSKECNKRNRNGVDGTNKKKNVPSVSQTRDINNNFVRVEANIVPSVDEKNTNKHIEIPTKPQSNDELTQYYDYEEHKFDKIEVDRDHDNSDEHLKLDTIVIVPETFEKSLKQKQHMATHDKWKHDKRDIYKNSGKPKDKYKNKQTATPSSKTCWQANDGKTFCQKFEKNKHFTNTRKLEDQYIKRGRGDNHWYEKRNAKNELKNSGKKYYKKDNWENNHFNQKPIKSFQSKIVEKSPSWVLTDTKNTKQNNVSGEWILKMSNGRAEYRKLEHKSDWLFDRADARKSKRERNHVNGNWYFQRARGREYCRYYPNSDWCKSGTYVGPNYNWFHQNDNGEHSRLHNSPRWSKKFVPRTFAAAGKFMKDTISNFQSKINYHSHR